jgi:nucleoside-diphosphate-sugar epimerase
VEGKDMTNNKTVLIDGTAGFLGQYLVSYFLDKGFTVRATDLANSIPTNNKNIEYIKSDLLNQESLNNVCANVDYVVHAAAAFDLALSRDTLYNINAQGTKNLILASIKNKVKHFVHISTADIYGELKYIPADENHPANPVNNYSLSKLEAEYIVSDFLKKGDLVFSVLRPTMIYGPQSKYIAALLFAIPAVLSYLGIKRAPFFKIKNTFTPVHVEDVAGAASFVCGNEKTFNETYNIAENDIISKGEFVNTILSSFNFEPLFTLKVYKPIFNALFKLLLFLPDALSAAPLNNVINKYWQRMMVEYDLKKDFVPKFVKSFFTYFVGEHAYTNSKITSLGFSFKYPSFVDEFKNTLTWYRNNKWLPPNNGKQR